MRLVVRQGSFAWVLRWTQRLLFAGAVLLLGYCGLAFTDAWMTQRLERRNFDRMLTDRHAGAGPVPGTASPSPRFRSTPALTGDLVGRIAIPRLDLSVMVIEGTSATILRRAVGHIPGTALPGEPGNVGLSGHRDTFFRPLRNIRQNDTITLTTVLGEYRYRVVSTKVVAPEDIAVLHSSNKQILTLITCYPFYFVGSAPDRFIVRAERVEDGS